MDQNTNIESCTDFLDNAKIKYMDGGWTSQNYP